MRKKKRARKRPPKQDNFWDGLGAIALGVATGVGLSIAAYKGLQALRPRRKKVIEQIVENVFNDKQDPKVMNWVRQNIIGDERDQSKQVLLIYRWMRANLKWLEDSTEDRAYPFFTVLERGGGDCDDLAAFFCTCTEAVGIRTSIIIFEGREVDGVIQQGHAVPIIRSARDVAENAGLAGNPRMIRAPEGTKSFYWLICDPQTGNLREMWRKRIMNGDYVIVHNTR